MFSKDEVFSQIASEGLPEIEHENDSLLDKLFLQEFLRELGSERAAATEDGFEEAIKMSSFISADGVGHSKT